MGFTLKRHQVYGSSMMDALPALGLFYDMGTGKTATTLDWLYRAIGRGEVSQALVVCPATMTGTWERAVDKMYQFDGYTPEGIEAVRACLTITSFQRTYKRVDKEVRHKNGKVSTKRRYVVREEIDHDWDAIIVDESHCIGAHDSVQTKTMLALAPSAKHRYILTGTPVTGGGGGCDYKKMYGQINFLEPGFFRTWTDFKQRCVLSCDPWGNPRKYRNDVCEDILKSHGIVARLVDCVDMPPRTDTFIPCEIAEKTIYNDIVKGKWTKYGFDVTVAGGQNTKLLQICSGHLKTPDGTRRYRTSKIQTVLDLLNGTDGKVIIFALYLESIAMLSETIPDAVVFRGGSGETWREVQEGSKRVAIIQYSAGSSSLDLYAANTMIFYEPTMSSLALEQARGRIFRTGQTKKCTYIYLYTPKTVEENALKTVCSGVDVTREMLDSWAHEIQ